MKAPAPEMTYFHKNGRSFVRCTSCASHLDMVKRFANKGNIPAIAREYSTMCREDIVALHLESIMHKVGLKAKRIASLPPATAMKSTLIGKSIIKP